MPGNRPKDRIRHSEHGESLKSGTTFLRENLNITVIRESISFPSREISATYLEKEAIMLVWGEILMLLLEEGTRKFVCDKIWMSHFDEKVIIYVRREIWKMYLKDVFTEFFFKRIRKLRLEMTATIFVCGHFGRVTPSSPSCSFMSQEMRLISTVFRVQIRIMKLLLTEDSKYDFIPLLSTSVAVKPFL